jgi:glutamyl-tRNA synthetase
MVRAVAAAIADRYRPDGDDWFDQIRRAAVSLGFAPSRKVYRQDPAAYPGSIVEASQVVRVLLTGTRDSPGLAPVAIALGPDEVLRRIGALGGQREAGTMAP